MNGMNHLRQAPILPSPPVDFPVYGLDASWPGSRWLEMFGEAIGDPVHWVTLFHQSLGGESVIAVETFSRLRTDALMSRSDETPLQHVAHYAGNTLINVTLPERSEPWPDGFLPTLSNYAYEHSRQCAQWPLARWRVNGAAVTARVWRFAGGWVAVSDAVGGVYLAAVGVGTDPDGLSLAVLQDASAYHFDLYQPLHIHVVSASRDRAGSDALELRRCQDLHADQLRLLPDQR
jgi:hypothetical protein